jgi:cell division septum initiation protein DivIVA
MSEAARVILQAIEEHKKQIKELESALKKLDADLPRKRQRKKTGLREGSMPSRVEQILKAKRPLAAADISEELKKMGHPAETRVIASALKKYIESDRVFERTAEGLYTLRSDAA